MGLTDTLQSIGKQIFGGALPVGGGKMSTGDPLSMGLANGLSMDQLSGTTSTGTTTATFQWPGGNVQWQPQAAGSTIQWPPVAQHQAWPQPNWQPTGNPWQPTYRPGAPTPKIDDYAYTGEEKKKKYASEIDKVIDEEVNRIRNL